MEILNPFISTIWKTKINYKNKYKLIEEIEKYCIQHKNLTPKGWNCEVKSSFMLEDNKIPEDLKKIIEKKINKFLDFYKNKIKINGNYFISDIWFNYYKSNEFQEPHIHKNSLFSGCYYLKFDYKSHHQTTFYNPNHYFDYSEEKNNPYFCFSPNCREDDLIIFPSLLNHSTMGIKSGNESRITISFNICNHSIQYPQSAIKKIKYQ